MDGAFANNKNREVWSLTVKHTGWMTVTLQYGNHREIVKLGHFRVIMLQDISLHPV